MIYRLVILTLISAFISISHAESMQDVYASLMDTKREQIANALALKEKDNSDFWALYDKYQQKQSIHDHDAFNLIRKFNDKYKSGQIEKQSMINMQAEFFRIEGRKLQTKQNHAEFFSNILSPEDVFRFYQIESTIDAQIHSKTAEVIPLVAR